ncbi:hypothetical protein ES705_00697 [subsurface metagenome]|nr:helix-turn-helix domain-containing protein [Clostridia bacterium]
MPQALTEFDKKIGKKIRNYRITHDISQEALGKYLRLPKQAISRMENGKRRITIEELEKIALFFDEPIQLFLKDEYRYIYPKDFSDTSFPVFMTEFLDEYIKALSIDPGKKNISYMFTDKLIKEIKHLRTSITNHRLFQQKQRERKEKEN